MKGTTKPVKKSQEDLTLDRVLLWFGGAVVLEFLVLLLNRYYVNFSAGGTGLAYAIARFLRVARWVSLGATVLFLVWRVLWRKRKERTWLGVLFVLSLAVSICCFVSVTWRRVGVQFLYVAIPVVAVLGLVYYLYQREFFLIAVLGSLGLFDLWSYRKMIPLNPAAVYAISAVVAAVTLAAAAVFYLTRKDKGRLPGKRGVKLLPPKANYVMLFAGCAVNVVSILAALLFGVGVAYVFIFLVMAWLFAAVVYYTVRLL